MLHWKEPFSVGVGIAPGKVLDEAKRITAIDCDLSKRFEAVLFCRF